MASTAHKTNNDRNRNRATHLALAALVELRGDDKARTLYDAAVRFNETFFDGTLLPSIVEITPPASMRSLADYRPCTAEGIESHIRIGAKVVERGPRYALDILLHEMIHAYCWEQLGDIEPGYAHHGPKWTAQCNRIGRMLGLDEVFTKGRGGPNSARWPLCVRPEGYYEPEPTKPVKPGKDAGEGEGEGESAEREAVAEQVHIAKQLARLIEKANRATLEALLPVLVERLDTAED